MSNEGDALGRPTATSSQTPPLAARWGVIRRDRGEDASALLRQLVGELRRHGVSVAGFVQVPKRRKAQVVAYELRRLAQDECLTVARRVRAGIGKRKRSEFSFQFEVKAFTQALTWIERDGPSAQVVVIDGIGALEGRGAGHYPALAWAQRQKAPKVIITTIRRDQYGELSRRLGLRSRRIAELDLSATAAERRDLVQRIAARC